MVVLSYREAAKTRLTDTPGQIRADSTQAQLVEQAKNYGRVLHRPVPKQIGYWSQIGKIAEENPDLPFAMIRDILVAQRKLQPKNTASTDAAARHAHMFRAAKKLHPAQKVALDVAVRAIVEDPAPGDARIGDLAGVRVCTFRLGNHLFLPAYTQVDEETITLLALGSHENFQRDLKRS